MGRAEIFGSFLFDTRIDRDLRPLFIANSDVGGIVDRYPRDNQYWTGDNIGDFYLGAKINLMSEFQQKPAAAALRIGAKLPTGDEDVGNSTGKPDVFFDFILSKEARQMVDVSAFAGYEVRGKPDGFEIPSGAVRWGAGVGFPSRKPLRAMFELTGMLPNEDEASIAGSVRIDGSVAPALSATENITKANFTLNWQHRAVSFIGGGVAGTCRWTTRRLRDRRPDEVD